MLVTKSRSMKFYKIRLLFVLIIVLLSLDFVSVHGQDVPVYPTYIVETGDTLSLIALKFDVDLTQLVSVNEITDPNAISIGTKLNIPGFEGISGTLSLKTAGLTDSLTVLGKKHQVPINNLVKLNRLTSPQQVYVGSELIVPETNDDQPSEFFPAAQLASNPTVLETSVAYGINQYMFVYENLHTNSWQITPGTNLYSSTQMHAISVYSPVINDIWIQPLPLQQGSTFSVNIETKESVDINGLYDDLNLDFSLVGPNHYTALIGINAINPPGLHPLKLSVQKDGNQIYELEQFLLVNAGIFGEMLALTVDPATIDPTVIAEEESVVDPIITQYTDQKFWSEEFAYPLDDACVRAFYGGERIYNNTYKYYHTGVDFGICANNLNIYAPENGVVVLATQLPIRGNITIIDHGLGVFSGYFHQDNIAVNVGDPVSKGQLIGTIGNTGRSTGAHLHWEIWVNGISVNPLSWAERRYP